jgi:hypothetical protein
MVQHPTIKTWKPAKVMQKHSDRSLIVQLEDGNLFRRNVKLVKPIRPRNLNIEEPSESPPIVAEPEIVSTDPALQSTVDLTDNNQPILQSTSTDPAGKSTPNAASQQKYSSFAQWEILTFFCRNSITFDREVRF